MMYMIAELLDSSKAASIARNYAEQSIPNDAITKETSHPKGPSAEKIRERTFNSFLALVDGLLNRQA
ncbi:MAG TPA: hypothetical protein VEV84_06515, partial [Pyrinomonadaceae bacterium]|nr:hypothetical protein [Pyrinomonadaceae bacterium]